MDRQMVYPGAIPLETDLLSTNKDAYIALAKLAAAVLGTSTLLNGGAVTPTSPASLQVQAAPVEIYSLQNIDNTAYSSLAADTTHQIVKQGVNLNSTTLSCPAPGTVGNSINYLIQYGFSETDGGSVVLPYYNASNPAQAYSGPNNSGTPNNTVRQNTVNVQVKAGVSAPTGTQTTPSPDSGFVGGYVVTVANGQSTITSGNISLYSGAPFITERLIDKISQATADLRYAQQVQVQNSSFVYAVDGGAANAYTATLSPAITSYSAGLQLFLKITNANTSGTNTLNVNGLGTKSIKLTNGANPNVGDLAAGMIARLIYDGTNFQLINPITTTPSATAIQNNSYTYVTDTGAANAYVATLSPAVTSYVAGLQVYLKIANTNTGASTLNVNGLGAKNITKNGANALASGDLAAGQVAHLIYDGTQFQVLSLISTVIRSIKRQLFTSSGTYTPSAGMLYAFVELVGGGGGGGGNGTSLGSGGGAGGYASKLFDAATIGASQTITIGAGGTAGNNGGTTSFGALMSATGGNTGNTSGGSVAIQGGAGGNGSGGTRNINGAYGGVASAATNGPFSGWGAASMLGTQTPGLVSGSGGVAGSNGNGSGGGAGGGWNTSGGVGSDGIVIINEYCTL